MTDNTDSDTRSSERKQAIRAFGDDIVEKLRDDPEEDEEDENEDA